jgi:murein DD-endopeptidase MepM/ murein hydrolase activator NlpD
MNRRVSTFLSLLLLVLSVAYSRELVVQSPDKIVPHVDKDRRTQRDKGTAPQSIAKNGQLKSYGEPIYFQSGSVAQGQLAPLLYKTPSYYPCGYTYTAVLSPISGDPDLYLHQKVSGTWQKLKESLNGGTATDSFTFTCSNITSTATNVDLDVKGYTAASYNFTLYRQTTGSSGINFMEFPLHNGENHYTAKINAVLDHWMTNGGNCPDYKIVSYTNEVAEDQYGLSEDFSTPNRCGGVDPLTGYKQFSQAQFSINGQYNLDPVDNESGYYLFYDGHTGYDYPATNGTPVYPVAAGTAYIYTGDGSNNDVMVVHSNGYTSYYLHLSSRNISDGQPVTTATNLGGVGRGHLHLTIKKGSQRVDPYGWKGPAGQDPLKVDGGDNVCLWKTCN